MGGSNLPIVVNGTTITYTPSLDNSIGYIEFKTGESKMLIEATTPTYGVGFTNQFNNGKNKTQVLQALQRILRNPIGKAFFGQFMQLNESIAVTGTNPETFNFTLNGIRQNDKLVLDINDLPWGYDPNTGATSHQLGLTRTYQKGKIGKMYEAHLDPKYNINNGIAHYITIHSGLTNVEEIAAVLIHEMFVHVQKDVIRLEQLKNLIVNSPQYKVLIESLKSPEEDHCNLAKGNVTSYKNKCQNLDDAYNTVQHSLFYLRDLEQHKTENCK